MVAHKARIYDKLGQKDTAHKLLNEAMDAFKEHDYSKYLDIRRKSRAPHTLSRQ